MTLTAETNEETALLDSVQRRVLWLATQQVHYANNAARRRTR